MMYIYRFEKTILSYTSQSYLLGQNRVYLSQFALICTYYHVQVIVVNAWCRCNVILYFEDELWLIQFQYN